MEFVREYIGNIGANCVWNVHKELKSLIVITKRSNNLQDSTIFSLHPIYLTVYVGERMMYKKSLNKIVFMCKF